MRTLSFRHDWVEAGHVTGRDHSFTVPNLKEEDQVAFRVRAVNAVGASEPSRPTDAVIIQDQPGKSSPAMIRAGMNDSADCRKTFVPRSPRNQRYHRSCR